MLDTGEIQHTAYVCNGTSGSSGPAPVPQAPSSATTSTVPPPPAPTTPPIAPTAAPAATSVRPPSPASLASASTRQHLSRRHLHLQRHPRFPHRLLRPLRRSHQLRRLRQPLSGCPVLHRWRLRQTQSAPVPRAPSSATTSHGSPTACSDHSADRINCGACGNLCQAAQSCIAGVCVDPVSTCPAGTFICNDITRFPHRLLRPLRQSHQLRRLRQPLSGCPVLRRWRLRRPSQHLSRRHLHLQRHHRFPHRLLRPLLRSHQLRRLRQPLSGRPVLRRWRLRRPSQHLSRRTPSSATTSPVPPPPAPTTPQIASTAAPAATYVRLPSPASLASASTPSAPVPRAPSSATTSPVPPPPAPPTPSRSHQLRRLRQPLSGPRKVAKAAYVE